MWVWCFDFKVASGWWWDVDRDLHYDGRGRDYWARIEYWWVGGCCFGTNCAQDFDLKVDLDSIDVDDIAPPTLKLSVAKCHASLLSSFLYENPLYFGVNEMISFQKIVGILN